MGARSSAVRRWLLLAVGVSLAGCSDNAVTALPPAAGDTHPTGDVTVGGDRPATLRVPERYDGRTALPLIVLLHGAGASGLLEDIYLGLSARMESDGFFLLLPDGLAHDGKGPRIWNAIAGCCGSSETGADDVGYLRGLVDEAKSLVAVDASRVYFAGHSNGAFMAHRMACSAADQVAAVASLAGSIFVGDTCMPSRPVSVLEIHGDKDDTVPYDGGDELPGGIHLGFLGALDVARRCAQRSSCDTDAPEVGAAMDLDADGQKETEVLRYARGCAGGAESELWTIRGGSHVPDLAPAFAEELVAWLLQQRH